MAQEGGEFPITPDFEICSSGLIKQPHDVLVLLSSQKIYDVKDNAGDKCTFYRKGMSRSNSNSSIKNSTNSTSIKISDDNSLSKWDVETEFGEWNGEVIENSLEEEIIGKRMYDDGLAYKRRNILEKAFFYFRLSSDAHNYTKGSFATGLCYHRGFGVKINFDEAAHYYAKASNAQHWKAKYNWAKLILDELINGSIDDAIKLLWDACMAKVTEAENEYSIILLEKDINDPLAIEYLQKAADKKHPAAICNLGVCYEHGYGGVNKDIPKAISLYNQAKLLGEADAHRNLMELIKLGHYDGIGKAEAECVRWRSQTCSPVNFGANDVNTSYGSEILQREDELNTKDQRELELSKHARQTKKQHKSVKMQSPVKFHIPDQPDIQLQEVHKVQKSDAELSELCLIKVQQLELPQPQMKKTNVKESKVKQPELQKTEMKQTKVKQSEVPQAQMQQTKAIVPEVQQPKVQSADVQEQVPVLQVQHLQQGKNEQPNAAVYGEPVPGLSRKDSC